MANANIDVTPGSSDGTDPEKGTVETPESGQDDKSKNFAEVRKQLKERDDTIARLEAELEASKGNRTLGKDDEEDPEDKGDKGKKDKQSDAEKVAFQRDMKDAVREWNKGNKVSDAEWAQIQKEVTFKGDEVRSEILEKIQKAYESLPSYKEAREKALREEGRKEAMKQMHDQDLDIGGGGEGGGFGSGGGPTGLTSKEKRWLSAFGVSGDEQKNINRDADTNEWETGKQPVRKPFQAGT